MSGESCRRSTGETIARGRLVRSSATGCDDEAERGEHEDDRDSHEYGADHRQELPQDADAAAAAEQA